MNRINELINELNKIYDMKINYNKNYEMAFTHSSYINEQKNLLKHDSYERLEFLGDATLEISVSEYLYIKFPNFSEGQLTKIRASVVCEPSLVKQAKKLGFDKYIILGKGEEKIGGRNRPALLADIFESFLGALYLDKGLESVKNFLSKTLFKEIQDEDYSTFIDYKTILQEYISKEKLGVIEYKLISSIGPSHEKIFVSAIYIDEKKFGEGTAKTKKESEQIAAKLALQKLNFI
ncbi:MULTISPECIES: ribonuclease III [unclassified Gemella]|uniref:ribonuclease III n=1 Tax=unclassified Gemella TaxID=2624949 RepID=UPI001C05EA5A|nr:MULTISPECIES: ribonuclease III [unclassified Gemella]MBU0278334.1 ribonuclease III [Gemella sp. zg-1178]QWQ38165.1 ribonuclease III [Gemella sp. zg-570]